METNDVNNLIDKTTYDSTSFVYRFLINVLDPNTTKGIKSSFSSSENFYRGINEVITHGIASCISTCYENINPEDTDVLDEVFGNINFFNNIECLTEMDDTEKRRQIRNCFAHGHYKSFGSENRCLEGIYINNGKVRGKIIHTDLFQLMDIFIYLSSTNGAAKKNEFAVYKGPKYINLKNKSLLKQTLDELEYCEVTSSVGENNIDYVLEEMKNSKFLNDYVTDKIKSMVSRGLNHADLQVKKLTDAEKQQIICLFENESSYVLAQIDKMYPDLINTTFLEIIREVVHCKEICCFDVAIYPLLASLLKQSYKLTEEEKQLSVKYWLKRPFIFSKLLLQYSFFTFDYIREMNERHECALFQYRNFDLTGINFNSLNGENLVRVVDPKQRIQEEIDKSNKKIKNFDDAISKLTQKKQNIKSAGDKVPNGNDVISRIDKSIQLNQQKKEDENKKFLNARVKLNNCGDAYVDCRHLFRHFRNAITHKRYSVYYADALKTNDYGRIKFHFEDYDDIKDKNGNKIGEKLSFTLDCYAQSLQKFLNDINMRIFNILDNNNQSDFDTVIQNIKSKT